MEVTPFGIVNLVILGALKTPLPIDVTPAGMTNEVNCAFSKVFVPRFVRRLELVKGLVANLVVAKARFPTLVISSGSVIEVRFAILRNVLAPILVRLLGLSNVIEENFDSQKTESVRLVTLEGIKIEPGPAR